MNTCQQQNQMQYSEEYVHYLEQSVLELTQRIIALEEELNTLKAVGTTTIINENDFEKPSSKK